MIYGDQTNYETLCCTTFFRFKIYYHFSIVYQLLAILNYARAYFKYREQEG